MRESCHDCCFLLGNQPVPETCLRPRAGGPGPLVSTALPGVIDPGSPGSGPGTRGPRWTRPSGGLALVSHRFGSVSVPGGQGPVWEQVEAETTGRAVFCLKLTEVGKKQEMPLLLREMCSLGLGGGGGSGGRGYGTAPWAPPPWSGQFSSLTSPCPGMFQRGCGRPCGAGGVCPPWAPRGE